MNILKFKEIKTNLLSELFLSTQNARKSKNMSQEPKLFGPFAIVFWSSQPKIDPFCLSVSYVIPW